MHVHAIALFLRECACICVLLSQRTCVPVCVFVCKLQACTCTVICTCASIVCVHACTCKQSRWHTCAHARSHMHTHRNAHIQSDCVHVPKRMYAQREEVCVATHAYTPPHVQTVGYFTRKHCSMPQTACTESTCVSAKQLLARVQSNVCVPATQSKSKRCATALAHTPGFGCREAGPDVGSVRQTRTCLCTCKNSRLHVPACKNMRTRSHARTYTQRFA